MPVVTLYRFRIRDPLTGRWRETGHHMIEAEAEARYPERERLDWTREDRHVDPSAPGHGAVLGPRKL